MALGSGFQRLGLSRATLTRAGLWAVGLFALLAVVLLTEIPSIFPGYPAVVLSFVIWCILPGWLIQRSLLASRSPGVVQQAVFAFAMSVAVAAVPGVVALHFGWSLQLFGFLFAMLAAAACGCALLWQSLFDDEEPPEGSSGIVPLAVLVAIPLLAIATSPWWAGDRIARDADDAVYVGYVGSYANTGTLDPSAPFVDTKQGTYSRMDVEVWVVLEALVTKTAGVKSLDLHLHYLPGLLTTLAVATVFAVGKGLFRSTRIGLLAAALLIAQAFLDLAPVEGVGRMVLLRMAQDKMVATFVLMPVGILLGAWYLEKPSPRVYVATLLTALALMAVHPLGLMSMILGLAGVSVVRVLALTSRDSAVAATALVVPWAAVGGGFLVWSWLFGDQGDVLYGYPRLQFNITDLPGGMIIGNYHLFLHPMVIAAVCLVVPVWFLGKREIGNQALVGVVVAVFVVFFVPFVATPIANATRDEAVWRLYRVIPAALILAYALDLGLRTLYGRPEATGEPTTPQEKPTLTQSALAPAAGVLIIFSAAFLVQEQYLIVDGSAFYDRASTTTLLPWTDGSIFLGGVERAFSSDWRPVGTERALLEYLDENAPQGSVVLLPKGVSDRYFVGYLDKVTSASPPGTPDPALRRALIDAYYEGRLEELLPDGDTAAFLEGLGVDIVLVPPDSVLDDGLREFTSFELGELEVQRGEPLLVTWSDEMGDDMPAWAFDFDQDQRIGEGQFTVPSDMDTSHANLEFLIDVVNTGVLSTEGNATLVITYFQEGEVGTTSVVTDIREPEDATAGPFVLRRPVGESVEAGEIYSYIISTLPGNDGSPSEDILLTGVRVKYWPKDMPAIGGGGYFIFRRQSGS